MSSAHNRRLEAALLGVRCSGCGGQELMKMPVQKSDPKLRVAFAGVHRSVPGKHDSVSTENGSWPTNSHNWGAAFAAVDPAAVPFAVVGVFDAGPETRAAFLEVWAERFGVVPQFADFACMLRDAAPDVLVVATRQTYHAEMIEMAVAAGVRGILCDKPLCTTLGEADRIFAALEEAPRPVSLAYGTELRWDRGFQALRDVVASGAIGEVSSVSCAGVSDTINHGCHWYDACLMLLGDPEPQWVSGTIQPTDSRRLPAGDYRGGKDADPPPIAAHVMLDSGAVLTFLPSPAGSLSSLSLVGSAGRLEILCKGMAPGVGGIHATIWREGQATDNPDASQSPSMQLVPLPLSDPHEIWPRGCLIATDLMESVIANDGTGNMDSGVVQHTLCGVAQARRATEIGFAIHASSYSGGGRVTLPVEGRAKGVRVDSRAWGNLMT